MRILFVDQFGELGGAQRCLADLLPAILARGWTAHLAAPATGPLLALARGLGANAEPIVCGPYAAGRKRAGDTVRFARQGPGLWLALRRLIRRHGIHLLYVNGPRVLPAAALAAGAAPLVFHAHSRVPQPAAAWLARSALRARAAFVIASSNFVAEPLRRAVPAGRLSVIYNGVPAVARSPRGRLGAPRIGVIGRIAPEKGQLEFVEAARLLNGRVPGCEFVIAGASLFGDAAYERQVQAAAQGLPIQFPGWRDDVSAVLAGLDILAVPSTALDATPRVILEAYAAGVLVVAFRAGGLPEIVEPGAGMLTDPHPAALASALEALLENPAELERMGSSAVETWSARYRVERYQNEIAGILERLDRERSQNRNPLHSAGASART